jgi:hypothetical protein
MNGRMKLVVTMTGVMLVSAGLASAQKTPPPPPPDAMMIDGPGGEGGPGMPGDHAELLGFAGMHGGKVVTGLPFSAVAVTQTTHTLADGNKITRTIQSNVYRDSQGRVRKEVTLPAMGPFASSGQPKSIVVIHDPVSNSNFVLHADTKVAEKMATHDHEAGKGMGSGPNGSMKERFESRMQQAIADGTLKKEDLGTQTVAGVLAQGTRITRTIPAGQIGNEKAITIVSEHWYSNDLQMMVMSKRSDPRFGETTHTITGIQRTEPASTLFNVPADYAVKHGMPHGMGKRGMRQGPPPPPSPEN